MLSKALKALQNTKLRQERLLKTLEMQKLTATAAQSPETCDAVLKAVVFHKAACKLTSLSVYCAHTLPHPLSRSSVKTTLLLGTLFLPGLQTLLAEVKARQSTAPGIAAKR